MSTNNVNSGSGSGGAVTTGGAQMGAAAPRGLRQEVSQLIAGIQAVIPDGSSVTIGGLAMAKADLVNELSQISAVYQAIDAGVLAAKGARSRLKSGFSGFHKTYVGIKDAMIAFLGRGNPQLAQLGIKASTGSKPLTPAQTVVKAEKAKKTRALRHTMGKVQKAAVQYTGALEVAVKETVPAATANDTAPAAAPPAAAEAQDTVVAKSTPAETPVTTSHTQ